MEKSTVLKESQSPQGKKGITQVTVSDYKSISQEQHIEIRPLTILAGANSSGKSSIMQPLLLLKQTLEAPYDPGSLLLDGPNVQFTSADQLLSHVARRPSSESFTIGLEMQNAQSFTDTFRKTSEQGLDLVETKYRYRDISSTVRVGLSQEELQAVVEAAYE